jgi:uncharacterized protein (TIGR02145 family)
MKTHTPILSALLVISLLSCQPIGPEGTNKIETGTTEVSSKLYETAKVKTEGISVTGNTIDYHGHCWGETENPKTTGSHSNYAGEGGSSFSSTLKDLTSNTTYYVCPYFETRYETIYGDDVPFNTNKTGVPEVKTMNCSDETISSVMFKGVVVSDSGSIVLEYGFVWDTVQEFDLDTIVLGQGVDTFSHRINGLIEGKDYFVKAYAKNDNGTSYGEIKNFTTYAKSKPTVTTSAVSDTTVNSATCGGEVTSDGNSAVTVRGVVWNTSVDPTLDSYLGITNDGDGIGSFVSQLTDLEDSTTYYVCAYATNGKETEYGEFYEFTTEAISKPTVTTMEVADSTVNGAICGGNVTSDGNATVTSYGIVWGIVSDPYLDIEHNMGITNDGTGTGNFSSQISDLESGTTYKVRAYATNIKETAYGDIVTFSTLAITVPEVTTSSVTILSATIAEGGGKITLDGNSVITARGIVWNKDGDPIVENNIGSTDEGPGLSDFTGQISNLQEGTTYYVRAYASNIKGTGYGETVEFTTPSIIPPEVTTKTITEITTNSAVCGGNVVDEGNTSVTERGVCWGIAQEPTIADSRTTDGIGKGAYDSDITGLSELTIYYVRAYATNSKGETAYGDQQSFSTFGTLSDSRGDGNTYNTVTIGTQTWMAENLAYEISGKDITTDSIWENNTSYDGWCYYNNNKVTYGSTYGVLYQWEAAKIACPSGWHLPTDAEWKILEMYLGMSQSEADDAGWRGTDEGGKLKEAGTTNWDSPNTGATNSIGFSVLPGGYRSSSSFYSEGKYGRFWSSSDNGSTNAWFRRFNYDFETVYRGSIGKESGYSVRCVKD